MTSLLVKLFIKDRHNTKNSQVREQYGKFAGIVGIITNFFLFLIKIIVGTLFNSISITADAINNLTDSASSIITLIGFKISGKPADSEHPFGHARMESISGLIVSFIIVFLSFQLIQTSIQKIIHPEMAQFSLLTVAVLVGSILLKLWQCLFYRRIGKTIDSLTLRATSTDSRNDVVATSAVLIAAIVTYLTGFNLDGYMGVVVALFILMSGINLVKDTVSSLLGTAPTQELVDEIYDKIMTYDHIIGLHDLTVHNYGINRCYASVHCEVPADQDIMFSHDVIDKVEKDFLNEKGIHLVIHLDPVVTNDEKTNHLKATIEDLAHQHSTKLSVHDFRVVWGISQVNILFDIVVPFDFKENDQQLVTHLSEEIRNLNNIYNPIITIDHGYIKSSHL